MRRSRFSEEQIIGVLKELEAGLSAGEAARKQRVGETNELKVFADS